jgi:V/A-type H+-transporting ATPase subunit D
VSRVRASKHELKRQREALARYERYLPTLRLKQRQLQAELRRVRAEADAAGEEEARRRRDLSSWIELWVEPVPLEDLLELTSVERGEASVAGVSVPTLGAVRWRRRPPSPSATPPWADDALGALERLAELRLRRAVLTEQRARLAEELRYVSQRVNLFEKVQIPAARDAVRRIRIALGDQQAAAVVRAKIAKAKSVERERAT